MIRQILIDEFFENQPPLNFVDDLKEYVVPQIEFEDLSCDKSYVSPKGIYLVKNAFDGEDNLKTVYDDFDAFIKANKINGQNYSVVLECNNAFEQEQFKIEITDKKTVITAGDCEGIRRAVIRIEDLLLIGGGNLPIKVIEEKTAIKKRISRCFFSPINRPPKYGEELLDDIDYYPDGYLNKLMHDGVNAIWIYTELDCIVESEYFPEFGVGADKRMQKLNRVIDKCERYGIKVYLFIMLPMSFSEPTMERKYPGISKKYDIPGNTGSGASPKAFCTYSEIGEKYVNEGVKKLFSRAPKLGGMISITQGERVTSCANAWSNSAGVWKNNCPYCSEYSPSTIVTHTVGLIENAMHEVNPEAEFISWTYGHRGSPREKIREYVEKITDKAVMMQNFEDDGRVIQLGKKRFAFDYYLC